MKAKFLTAVLILGGLFATARESYGCIIPPVAILTDYPDPVVDGCSVTLDGCSSYDPDGYITQWCFSWDWDSDPTWNYCSTTNCKTTHIYPGPGAYRARLRVKDNQGLYDYDYTWVHVGEPTLELRKGPYLIYDGNNTEMMVLWQLTGDANCTLAWGLDPNCDAGSVQTSEYGTDHQHKYIIPDVNTATKYYYRVEVPDDANYSGSFRTAPDANATGVKFLAYGDTRADSGEIPYDHNNICSTIIDTYEADPNYQTFLLLSGDWVYNGDGESDWTTMYFNRSLLDSLAMEANIPIQGCTGNHEVDGGTATAYEKYWPYSYESGGRYWSFDYGPAHFVVVDQYTDYSDESAQLEWIEADLAASTKEWKFVLLHEPGYSAGGGHDDDTDVQTRIQPLCETYGVDIVFAGHNHYYARCDVNGVKHITTGGGGAPLSEPNENYSEYIEECNSVNHFCKIAISDCQLNFEAVDVNGTVIDSFTLTHRWYVNSAVSGGNDDGTSWENAFDDLQEALNVVLYGDEIWVAEGEGTYKPSKKTDPGDPRSATFQLVEGAAMYGGFAGTETARDQRDWATHETILSGDIGTIDDANDNCYHVVTGDGDANTIIDGFTITAGKANGSGSDIHGGGMYNSSCSPTIANCTFTDNFVEFSGGGMCNSSASVTVSNCTFSSNSASGDGGGMYNYNSSPTMTGCTFSSNPAFRGGGIYNDYSNPTVTNCTFTGNSSSCFALGEAYGGGGMFNCNSSPTVTNCTFSGNSADYNGGGMLNHDSSEPTVTDCTFSGNSADYSGGGMVNHGSSNPAVTGCIFSDNAAGWYGGGMYNVDSSPTVTNCIFSGNDADDGGGINNDYSSPSVINCAFSRNLADSGGGMYNYGSSSIPNVANCIFWGNDASVSGDEIYNASSADPNFRHCDIEGCGGSGGWDPNFGTDGGGNIDSDPCFLDANSPAGPDGIFRTFDDGLQIIVHSPCVDMADATVQDFKLTDITGRARIDVDYVDNTGVGDPNYADVGAYESVTIWFVDKDATAGGNDGTSWENAFVDLQSAFAVADGNDSAEIWVAEGTYKPTDGSDRSISFELAEDVGVYGGFAGTETARYERDWTEYETKLSGDIGTPDVQSDNSYHVVKGAEGAMLDGFTITAGEASGSGEDRYGGGMYNSGCSPTVMHCFFSNNRSSHYGGGMCNRTCDSPIVTNCTFSENYSGFGGGIANFPASPKLTNCTFNGNTASLCGGGMSNTYSHEGPSDPVATNCIFWADSAGDYDEIYNDDHTYPTFSYCDIEGSGGSGAWDPNFGTDGGGNIDSDPCFLDANSPAGPDGILGTLDDGLRLSEPNSPCVDAADGDAAPLNDVLGQPRLDVNDVNNTGIGDPNYADIGAYEFTYETVLTVTKVRVYTSADYNDNDGNGLNDCQVHFGHKDGTGNYAYPDLYIEVDATGGYSWRTDEGTLQVTSDSDSTGIEVDFQETGANTNKYRTVDPIHLATDSNQPDLELKVLDEETLRVEDVNGPEVDRGEVATITADVGRQEMKDWANAGADAFDEFFDKDEGPVPDPYYWWDGGEERDITSSVFPNFVKNVGNENEGLSFPADFSFECSHGDQGNFGYGSNKIYKPGSGETPTITSSDWEKDIEWAIFYSCHVLGQYRSSSPDAWITYWDDALIREPGQNSCHGILASCDILWAPPTKEHMTKFCEEMKGNNIAVIDAYMDTALDITWPESLGYIQTNVSALFHAANLDDYLNDVTPDTNDPNMYYTYYNFFGEDDPNDPNHWSTGDFARQYTSGTSTGCEVLCAIPTDQPVLAAVLVRKEVLSENALDHTGFDKAEFDNTGRVRFKKRSYERGPIRLSEAQARAKAASFIAQKGGGKPSDAELFGVMRQMVVTYNALDSENTRNEYVRKTFFEYGHKVDGIEIVGGNRGDCIRVGIAGDSVVGFNRHWRNIVGPIGSLQQVVSASYALDVAVENIPRVIILPPDGSYAITKIKLFYHGLPSEEYEQYLTPAWGFEVNDSLWVYVDAFTGEFL